MDFKEKITKESYLRIKNNLKAYAAAGGALRRESLKHKGKLRVALREKRNEQGLGARKVHIGLCFLRGKKYYEVQPNCKRVFSQADLIAIVRFWVTSKYFVSEQFKEDVKEFFTQPESKVEAA